MVINHPPMKYVQKGWGYELWIQNSELYCGKLLHFVKGKMCSLHYHKEKDETFYVQSGKLLVFYIDDWENNPQVTEKKWEDVVESVILEPGDNFYVPPGRAHQIIALETSELFEFSTQHFDEDSIRIIKGD